MRLVLMSILVLLVSACSNSPDKLDQCGTVSSYLAPVPEDGLYRAIVTHIDGRPVISKPNYQLSEGTYEFTLAELIDDPRLKVRNAARIVKPLSVKVQPNLRYHLAAQFNTDKVYLGDDDSFWQPEVRLKESYECELSPQ